jgi:two-component sensor histidine kinase
MALVRATQPGTVEIEGPDGDRVIGFQPPAATGTSLYVGAAISTREAFAPINASTIRSLALAAAGAAIACALAWVVGDRLFRQPILRMLKTIAAWRSGKESARTGLIPEGSELADLGAAIDEYMDKLVVDRAARRRAEERRSLLLREMNHRIKNILATVQALANQTFKGKTSAESLEAFGRRLSAMAATHDLLVSEKWESAEICKTIEAVIGPFDPGGRFTLDGPDLEITAKAALGLSMALHELCTNAAKYGALSCPEGSVDLRWRLQWDDDGGRFRLSWTEEGGPEIVEPKSSGFGTRLIEAALGSEMSATVSMRYPPSGAAVTIDADADLVLADSGARREGLAAE